jgi:hypothetical protein
MIDRTRHSDMVDLERSLRALADEDRHVSAPPHVQAAVMQMWEVARPFVQRRRQGRGRSAVLLALGSIAAAVMTVMVMDRAPSEPSRPASVAARVTERPRAVNNGPPPDTYTAAPGQRPPRVRTRGESLARRDPGLVLVADPILDVNALSIVRVRMPRTALAPLGIPFVDPNDGGSVDLEILVGEDGVARTIRRAVPVVVRQE